MVDQAEVKDAAQDAVEASGEGTEGENGKAAAADDGDEARQKALAAIAALKQKVVNADVAQENGAAVGNAVEEEPARPRKKRFGPPANAPRQAPKQRKRKSRWETEPTSDSKALIVNTGPLWPTDVTLPGGITVCPCTQP